MQTSMKVLIGNFEIEIAESVNCIRKYCFVEIGNNHFRNGFTEIRKFGTYRYFIKSTMNKNWSICNTEDLEDFCKYYLRLK